MAKMLKIALRKVKSLFYVNTNEVLLLLSVLFIIRVMELCYKIKDLSYLIIVLLFCAGWVLCRLYIWLKTKLLHIIILSSAYFNTITAAFIFKHGYLFNMYKLYLSSFHNIDNALRRFKDTKFLDYLPYLIIIIPVITAVNLYNLKRKEVVLSIASMLIFMLYLWYTGYGYDINAYFLIFFFLSTALYGVNIYTKSMDYFAKAQYKIAIKRNSIISAVVVISLVVTFMGYIMVEKLGSKNYFQGFNEFKLNSTFFQSMVMSNRYSLTTSGYGDNDGKLGGSIEADNSVAFRVKSDGMYYLRGSVKDFYDGFSWKKSSDEFIDISKKPIKKYSRDLFRYIIGYNRQQFSRNIRIGLENKEIAVYPENINTSTIFAPSNSYDMAVSGGIPGADDARSFVLLNQIKADSPYTVYFTWSRGNVEKFLSLYEGGFQFRYSTGSGTTNREKEYYKNYIVGRYSKYLQLPDNISPEIYKLVEEITKDYRTTSEKVYKINEYLYKNYEYSTDVSDIPEGQEFLKYFLFTEKKGYCTYFATASTIFYRIAGIPARYVEGFTMGDLKDNGGLYVVTSSMAHAWTEVLLVPEEDLWTTVDSTPPRPVVYENISYEALPLYDTQEDTVQPEPEEITTNESISQETSGENLSLTPQQWSSVQIIATSLLLLLVLYIIFRLVKFSKLKKSALYSNSMVPVYYYVKKRLKTIGNDSTKYDDDMIWLESIDDSELKSHISCMINRTYKEFYGKKEITEYNKHNLYFFIEGYIRKKQNVIVYYLKKYL